MTTSILGAATNGAFGSLIATCCLGFGPTGWQWWAVMGVAIVGRITGQVAG